MGSAIGTAVVEGAISTRGRGARENGFGISTTAGLWVCVCRRGSGERRRAMAVPPTAMAATARLAETFATRAPESHVALAAADFTVEVTTVVAAAA